MLTFVYNTCIKENENMIYLLYGEDNYLKERFLAKIKKEFGEVVLGINYIQIDENNVQELISDIETPAFGYEKKLIVARNTKLFTKKNSEAEKISDYLKENSLEDIILIFVEETVEKNALFNTISKVGEVKEFKELKEVDVINYVIKIANAYHVNIERYVAQYFVECTGLNMQDVINEIRKLIEYAGENGTITKEAIDNLTIKKSESIIFDLTDSLGKKQIKNAIQILHNLQYNKEPTQMILVMLYRHFKKLYFIHLSHGQNVAQNLKLKPNQIFLVNKYVSQARMFKKSELENLINALIELDEKSKNGNLDLDVGIEAILCNYCS